MTPPGRRTGPEILREGSETLPSASDRGRHFFPDRSANEKRRPEPRGDLQNPQDTSHGKAAPRREPESDHVRAEPYETFNRRSSQFGPDRGGRQDNLIGKIGQNNRPDRADRPVQLAISKPIPNPITGSKEFALSKSTDQKPSATVTQVIISRKTEETVSPKISPTDGSTPGESGEPSVRVPNRARPAIQLYQPKAKRRYQN